MTIDADVIARALRATQAAALAAAAWAGRGDPKAADGAATAAMRAVLSAPGPGGVVVTGEGAKDDAPMLADGELLGDAPAGYDIAVDPLECTDLCAAGLPGALATIAVAPRGTLWSPGPAFYMDKLVLGRAERPAGVQVGDEPEAIVAAVARRLGKAPERVRAIVLDKPRHAELIARLRATGCTVITPSAGDVAGALRVLLPGGGADVLLGVGGTPEGVLAAAAARALGGVMEGRLSPRRDDERAALAAAGIDAGARLELADLVPADATFIATGITGGLLDAPRRGHGEIVTDSIVISAGAVDRIRRSTVVSGIWATEI